MDPDRSSRKVGVLTVIVGFEPKLFPKSSELPEVYSEFELRVVVLKSAKFAELMDVNVSEPEDVRIIEEERL